MRVLVLGIGQMNFLSPLYQALKEARVHWHFDIYHPKHASRSKGGNNYHFSFLEETDIGVNAWIGMFFRSIIYRVLLNRFSNNGLRGMFRFMTDLVRGFHIASKYGQRYDLFHVHFISYINVLPILFLKTDCPVICSFWGSDLLRRAGNLEHFVVQRALRRASLVTIQSIELREIILSKYGRNLLPKIGIIQFLLNDQIFVSIENMSSFDNGCNKYFANTGIDQEKVNIVIGHNANSENQHIEVIDQLKRLDDGVKKRCKLILPLTYGIKESSRRQYYLTEIVRCLSDSGFEFKVIDHFLNLEELAFLRAKTDIYIHVPVSDALSGALTEGFFAGSVVITGAWLPYGPFKRAGITFVEIEELSRLSSLIANIYKSLQYLKRESTSNRNKVRETFISSEVSDRWIYAYESLLPG